MHAAVQDAHGLIRLEQAIRDDQARRLERAVMLAPTIGICEALLRGEHIPLAELDPVQLIRYGRRRSA